MNNNDKKELIFLDRNENNYGPSPQCLEVFKDVHFKQLSFYTRIYEKNAKSELSLRLAKDYNVLEKQVVIGYGGEDLLKSIVHSYLKAGETLFVPAFSWWYYKSIASEMGGKTVEYPLYAGDDRYHYDIDGMLKLYREVNPKIVFISTPNNPTGNSLTTEELYTILDEMKDTIVVLDEAYAMFKTTDYSYVREVVNRYPKTAVIRTFSKYFALAGVRIGFAVIGKELDYFEWFSSKYLGYSRINELIALAALDSMSYYEEITAKMNTDKETFFTEFSRLSGFKPYRSDANFILVDMVKERMSLLENFLKEKNLIIKFMNEEVLNSQLRITIGTQRENKLLMDAIKEYSTNNSPIDI